MIWPRPLASAHHGIRRQPTTLHSASRLLWNVVE
jgi:hypothetical protein